MGMRGLVVCLGAQIQGLEVSVQQSDAALAKAEAEAARARQALEGAERRHREAYKIPEPAEAGAKKDSPEEDETDEGKLDSDGSSQADDDSSNGSDGNICVSGKEENPEAEDEVAARHPADFTCAQDESRDSTALDLPYSGMHIGRQGFSVNFTTSLNSPADASSSDDDGDEITLPVRLPNPGRVLTRQRDIHSNDCHLV